MPRSRPQSLLRLIVAAAAVPVTNGLNEGVKVVAGYDMPAWFRLISLVAVIIGSSVLAAHALTDALALPSADVVTDALAPSSESFKKT